jgi:threonine/homoserine/homoserine lactone efflux protein
MKQICEILFGIGLLILCAWFGNLAAYNWWATGVPSTVDPAKYALRGNLFFGTASIVFIGFVVYCVWIALKHKRKAASNAR